jgi:ABC-type nitrate/sulfonate/bicarbonate transport system substrate-binding protein
MKNTIRHCCLSLFLLIFVSQASAERIRTAIPQANWNYLSVLVAEEKGFFRDERLENETIALAGPRAIAALVSGDVDYSGGGGSGMRAAVKGLPFKAIMFQTEKVTWYLVAAPEIRQISDLKGKRIGVTGIGDTTDTMTTMLLERNGITRNEFIRVTTGTNPANVIAGMKSGSFHAASMDTVSSVIAEREGLKLLGFIGDVFPLPFQGFGVMEKKLAENPQQVKRWLRAMIGALMFIRDKPEEATDVGIKRLRIKDMDRSVLIEGVKRYTRALPKGVPGKPSAEGLKNVLHFDVAVPMKITEELQPARLVDLRLVEEVIKELEARGYTK